MRHREKEITGPQTFLPPIDGTVSPTLPAHTGYQEQRNPFNEMSRRGSISVCRLKYKMSLTKAVLKANPCLPVFTEFVPRHLFKQEVEIMKPLIHCVLNSTKRSLSFKAF